ncbi:MAG: hypothetical protein IPK15_21945 [Verrucomicrobia bacterium]|nr:hypothetical protein [Verrucomicrobiota bacterium]
MLTILDEYTRECHVLRAERALKAADVLHWLQKAVAGARGPGVSAERQRLGVHREDRAAVAEGEPGQDHLH